MGWVARILSCERLSHYYMVPEHRIGEVPEPAGCALTTKSQNKPKQIFPSCQQITNNMNINEIFHALRALPFSNQKILQYTIMYRISMPKLVIDKN